MDVNVPMMRVRGEVRANPSTMGLAYAAVNKDRAARGGTMNGRNRKLPPHASTDNPATWVRVRALRPRVR